MTTSIVVVGGCGRVGLPLSIAFADQGCRVTLYDVNEAAVAMINEGQMPFLEEGAEKLLQRVVDNKQLWASSDPSVISESDVVIVVIGTPVDEFMNPDADAVLDSIDGWVDHLRDGQLLVLRSTVFPGVSRRVNHFFENRGLQIDISFCPERIAEGRAFTELYELPQIVSGFSENAVARARELFLRLTDEIVICEPEEAELAKLFTNTWRYIKFAAANQFFMIANSHGVDFSRVRYAITYKYPRASDMPGPGFAAGPCLFKDTMQLASYHNNNFTLGYASLMVNEGFPLYIASRLSERFQLRDLTVGILGMAFKAESDDTRSSLAYKLRKVLRTTSKEVLCTDPYVKNDPRIIDLETVCEKSDLLVIAAPHTCYRGLQTTKPIVDVWDLLGHGTLV